MIFCYWISDIDGCRELGAVSDELGETVCHYFSLEAFWWADCEN